MSITAPGPVTSQPTTLREARIPEGGLYEGTRILRPFPEGWEERPYEHIEVRPQTRVIGAEIRGADLTGPLAPAVREELNRALLEWKVLFFRGAHLTSEQQAASRGTGESWRSTRCSRAARAKRSPVSTRARAAVRRTRTSGTRTSPSANAPPWARCSSSARSRRSAGTPCGRTWPPRTTTCRPR